MHTIAGDVGCINDFKTWSKHRLERAALKSFRPLLLWVKTKARGCARDAGKTTQRMFLLKNLQGLIIHIFFKIHTVPRHPK